MFENLIGILKSNVVDQIPGQKKFLANNHDKVFSKSFLILKNQENGKV